MEGELSAALDCNPPPFCKAHKSQVSQTDLRRLNVDSTLLNEVPGSLLLSLPCENQSRALSIRSKMIHVVVDLELLSRQNGVK